MAEDAVRVRTLPTQVAARLTRRFASPGYTEERAPSELDVMQEFGVSRVVAREAFKILAALDIVQVSQGRRVVIRPKEEWDYLSPLLVEWLPPLQVDELLVELHEMRLMLEPELAAKAAETIDSRTLEALRAQLGRMVRLANDPDSFLDADHEFHLTICRAANNRILDRIMYSARWLSAASRRVTNEAPNALRRATEAHHGIFAAIEARDPSLARERMRAHLAHNVEILTGTKRTTRKRAARSR
jgi:DNA-binding FadR family transcriptional regulator